MGSFCNVSKETRMEKRILAVLIAAWAGAAYAQSTYVTSGASGNVVTNGYGQCWQSGAPGGGASVACPPAAGAGQSAAAAATRTQVAQSDYRTSAQGTPAPKRTASQPAGATGTHGNPPPPSDGYVGSGAGVVATSPYGLCWHGAMEWTPDKAAAPCDAVPRASVAAAPVAQAPAPAPAPLAEAAPRVIEKISLSTDVLFAFNKAELTPAGEQKLDQLA
jgi:outer membrane protein OmpA-like peptidoglycan-associated protein